MSDLDPAIFTICFMDSNVGGAGGFKHGIKVAYSQGADYIWCMDDDCLPELEALQILVESEKSLCREYNIGFLASRVEWADGELAKMNLPVAHRDWSFPHKKHPNVSKIVGSSFVSLLISRHAVELVGLPVAEFFIWFDDSEYTRRISDELDCFLISNSVVVHQTATNPSPLDFDLLDDGALWKYKYGVRNEMSFFLYSRQYVFAFLYIAKLFFRVIKAGKIRYVPGIAAAVIKGLLFNYRKYIEYPSAK